MPPHDLEVLKDARNYFDQRADLDKHDQPSEEAVLAYQLSSIIARLEPVS